MRKESFILRAERQRIAALRAIQNLDLEKPWRVTVEPYRKKRTLSQNALMWAWLEEVAQIVGDYSGHDKDEIHDYLKQKFLRPKFVEINGEAAKRYSTRDLTTQEMSEYMQKIEAWATTELGLVLPTPQSYGEML